MALAVLGLVLLSGCDQVRTVIASARGHVTDEPPIVPIRNMFQQPHHASQTRNDFFADGRAMRPLVEGTVAREMDADAAVATGWDGTAYVNTVPRSVAQRDFDGDWTRFVARGQGRYDVFCGPCHGLTGDGRGMVSRRAEEIGAGAMVPPTLHTDSLRHIPDGQLFATISNGIRNMPAYRHSMPVADRWAIVAYVRALQLDQRGQRQAMRTEVGQ